MQPDSAIYRSRRQRVIDEMGDGVMVVATAPEVARNRDTHSPYRHDSYFYWLTGFNEPEAVVVLVGLNMFAHRPVIDREMQNGIVAKRQLTIDEDIVVVLHWRLSRQEQTARTENVSVQRESVVQLVVDPS